MNQFCRQTWALSKKNLLLARRKYISTAIRALVFPILLIVLLLEIQNFTKDSRTYGLGPVHQIKSLSDSLQATGKPLVIVHEPGLGKDFAPVLDRLRSTLGQHTLIQLTEESQLDARCPVDFHGQSPCHAAVLFTDSPKSGAVNASWKYDIRTDPGLDEVGFNVYNTDGPTESIILPLQSAIDNAIMDSTSTPSVQAFTPQSEEEHAEVQRQSFQALALYILSFVFFLSIVPVAQHVASWMVQERQDGLSQLVDTMGNGTIGARVMSYVATFDLLYLPLWIILGSVFWTLLLPGQSVGIVIFWYIFTGWSVTSFSIFLASFFRHHALGSLFVYLIQILLAVLAAYTENSRVPAPLAQVVVLSLLFPSMNYVYFFSFITKAEISSIPLNLTVPLANRDLSSALAGQGEGRPNWVSSSGAYFLWIILIVQIIGYPFLAMLVESRLWGNNRRGREFHSSTGAIDSQTAIQTSGLTKKYKPSWLSRIFCCARTPDTKAVDELQLSAWRNQVLCLLGPNGSGKTTTLEMLAGFHRQTSGTIDINAPASSMGVCPQKNVLWDSLTVNEHLSIWNGIKGNTESKEALGELIRQCDLGKKRDSLAGSLSGGMKRKLQLACMLVGGSSICFADEISSGLDPLSRRHIWNVILRERARRTIVLTTHFLDEAEVLSDHIAIVTLGKMKCQGTPAELKTRYGGGYRVHIPLTENVAGISYPIEKQRDGYVCTTRDSSEAAALLASLKTSKDSDVYITGPTIEQVFLSVAEDAHTLARDFDGDAPEKVFSPPSVVSRSKDTAQAPATLTKTYLMQIRALFIKRIILLRSTWWMYVFALGIPIVVAAVIGSFLLGYVQPECGELVKTNPSETSTKLTPLSLEGFAVGPPSVNNTVTDITNVYADGLGYNYFGEGGIFVRSTRDALETFVHAKRVNLTYGGAMWAGNDSFIAYDTTYAPVAPIMLNLLNQVRGGVMINTTTSSLSQYSAPSAGSSVIWVTIFSLVQTLYPAFFALYPTYERRSQVRSLMYSNGLRPLPVLLSYWMFDGIFVIIIAVVCTILISPQAPWFFVGYLFIIQAFYGLAATLFAYLVSFIARSQPGAFALSVLLMAAMYVISLIAFLVPNTHNVPDLQVALDGTTYGLGLVFPIQNLLRGFAVSLNTNLVRCRGSVTITDPRSVYTYGGPILLLIIQNIWLFVLLLWVEGGNINIFSKPKTIPEDDEKSAFRSGRPDVDAETERVMSSQSDLLSVQHVSKNFGTFNAVDDVSLGIAEGEVLALLGPNGAGKTTSINMMRGDLTPSSGKIYIHDVDVHKNTRLAQRSLGVCGQHDALDMLTVREHLEFFARAKGVPNMKADVTQTLATVGLTAHAKKAASKLSGGNKRKLSLAIALIGNPRLLILDEPSSAMDAASKRVLWKTIQAVSPGRSVLITTHSMEEADALATKAAIVARRVLAVGTTEQLRKTHCNEYHVDLILASAPLSSWEEMRDVAEWVRRSLPGARFDGQNLGGQVRFVVPADSKVPQQPTAEGAMAGTVSRGHVSASQSFTRYLIETLEANKDRLGLECYSISAATMESVFLRVVKESDAEEDERVEKRSWWKL